jgi:hypothetical protein
MPLVIHTPKNQPYDVEIAGVGVVGGSGRGGFTAERVAQVAQELQDDEGKPLTGKKLEDAATAWAESRGLAVKSLKNVDEEKLRVEGGALPTVHPIEEVARQAAERDGFIVEAMHANPEAGVLDASDLPVRESDIHPQTPAPLPGQSS